MAEIIKRQETSEKALPGGFQRISSQETVPASCPAEEEMRDGKGWKTEDEPRKRTLLTVFVMVQMRHHVLTLGGENLVRTERRPVQVSSHIIRVSPAFIYHPQALPQQVYFLLHQRIDSPLPLSWSVMLVLTSAESLTSLRHRAIPWTHSMRRRMEDHPWRWRRSFPSMTVRVCSPRSLCLADCPRRSLS